MADLRRAQVLAEEFALKYLLLSGDSVPPGY